MSKPPSGTDPPSPRKRNPRYGQGSEYQARTGRHAGQFVAVLLVYDEGATRARPVPCYGPTPDAAREARERKRRHLAGDLSLTNATVQDYLTRYCQERAAWSERTRRYNLALLTDHIGKHLGKVRLTDLTARQIAGWLAKEQATHTGATVLHNAFRLLNTACKYAVRLGELEVNRCERVEAPARPAPRPASLTAAQARALLTAARASRHYTLILLLLSTGLRLGEALGLRWQDVTLAPDSGTIRVQQALSGHDTGAYALIAPKTPKSRRELAMVEPLVSTFRARGTAQKRERLRAGAAWHEPIPGLIFTSQSGAPYGRGTIGRALARLCDLAAIPRVSPHDLRRTWATLQADEGTPIHAIRDGLGHTTNRMALDYVQGAALAQGPALAARMAAILGDADGRSLAPIASTGTATGGNRVDSCLPEDPLHPAWKAGTRPDELHPQREMGPPEARTGPLSDPDSPADH